MRLFTALELNSKVIVNLTELVRRLRPVAPIAWVHPQNMHVSLKYVGEWPSHRLDEVIQALDQVKLPTALNIPLASLGFFPNARLPRVFWVGAEKTPGLRQLHSQVDSLLQPLGIAPEVRPYHPHLTLGTIRPDESLEELHQVIEDLPTREFGCIAPERFVLFESGLTPSGPVYRRVAEFGFVQQLGEQPVAAATRVMYAGKA